MTPLEESQLAAIRDLLAEKRHLLEQNQALRMALLTLLKPMPGAESTPKLEAAQLYADKNFTAVEEASALLEDEAAMAEVEGFKHRLRFLDDLAAEELAPTFNGAAPYWAPKLAPIDGAVQYAPYGWEREYHGETITLDRSGSHLSSASSVLVAWGELTQEFISIHDRRAGYVWVPWFLWEEPGVPHPLGAAARGAKNNGGVWVPHTRARLVSDLIVQGRVPELGNVSAWVGEKSVRLDRWAKHVSDIRREAIEEHGRGETGDGGPYDRVKRAYGQAVTMMMGSGTPRVWAPGVRVRRPDWSYAIQDLSAVSIWRTCDDLRAIAVNAGHPALAPVAIMNTDELLVPAEGFELLTGSPRRRPSTGKFDLAPIKLDPTGIALGSWKVKE